jgi:hypothetical protein
MGEGQVAGIGRALSENTVEVAVVNAPLSPVQQRVHDRPTFVFDRSTALRRPATASTALATPQSVYPSLVRLRSAPQLTRRSGAWLEQSPTA